jgi:hypothetical protein
MAQITVNESRFPGKTGAPIYNAQFARLTWPNGGKSPTVTPLPLSEPPYLNVYTVFLPTGSGKIRVSAASHGSDDIDITNGGAYQVLL